MSQYLAVLGRQPELSLAELTALFGSVHSLSSHLALIKTDQKVLIGRLGGTLKLGRRLSRPLVEHLLSLHPSGKFVLGVSDYSPEASATTAKNLAMKLKKILTRQGRSTRLLLSPTATLSTATCHHNQLGEKPGHYELLRFNHNWYLGCGVQNITAYASRDQARPARDAKIGMLPPKLAQILINLCGPLPPHARLLDPFCGTGVLLQEAALLGYRPYGTDLNPKMVEYTKRNLKWLSSWAEKRGKLLPSLTKIEDCDIIEGDATNFIWRGEIHAVACETYLGPPLSSPPPEIKLKTIKAEVSSLLLQFLKNLSPQIPDNTPVVLATPAWLRPDGQYSSLNLLDEIPKLGYNVIKIGSKSLAYHREGQIVAREIIVLRKKSHVKG